MIISNYIHSYLTYQYNRLFLICFSNSSSVQNIIIGEFFTVVFLGLRVILVWLWLSALSGPGLILRFVILTPTQEIKRRSTTP